MRKMISLIPSITLLTPGGDNKKFNISQETFQKLKHFNALSRFNNTAKTQNNDTQIDLKELSGVLLDSIKSYDIDLYNVLVNKEGIMTPLFTDNLSLALEFIFSSDAYAAPNKDFMDLFPHLNNRPFRHILFALMDYFQATELQDKIENGCYKNTFDDPIFPPTIRSIHNPSIEELNKYTHLVHICLDGKDTNKKLLMISRHPVKHLRCDLFDLRVKFEFPKDCLKNIKSFDLGHAKNIPQSLIHSLENGSIELLYLYYCNLQGLEFHQGCLRNMKTLTVYDTENIPQSLIDALENNSLELLDLSSCDLQGLEFHQDYLRNINTLNLRNSKNIPQSLIDALKNNSLELLDLSGCDLQGLEFHQGCLKNIKKLHLNYAENIPQSLIHALENGSLKLLKLSGCNLKNLKFTKGCLRNIKTLHLTRAQNILQSLIDLLENSSIELLKLSGCDLQNLKFTKICFKNIKTLRLMRTQNIPQSLIDALENGSLEHLDLSGCDLQVLEFPEGCLKNIKKLNLEYAKNIPQSLHNIDKA